MDRKEILIVGAIFLILLGFGISEIVIYEGRDHSLSGDHDCPEIERLDKFTAEKQLWDQWHWTYKIQEYSGRIEHYCPTLKHDVNIFYEGKFAGRSDGKIVTAVSKTYIKDCHGKIKYTVRTGDVFETIVNGNKIFVSFELRLGNEDEVVAYADQTNFFSNHIVLRNTDGDKVSELERDLVTVSLWTWEIKVLDHDHPAGDPLLLQILAGKTAFSDDDDSTDICNNYFWILAWAFLAVGILIFFVVGYLIYECIRNGKRVSIAEFKKVMNPF
jgi:hypothetical protein